MRIRSDVKTTPFILKRKEKVLIPKKKGRKRDNKSTMIRSSGERRTIEKEKRITPNKSTKLFVSTLAMLFPQTEDLEDK